MPSPAATRALPGLTAKLAGLLLGVAAGGIGMELPTGIAAIAGEDGGTAVAIGPHQLVTLHEALPAVSGGWSVGRTLTVVFAEGRQRTVTVERVGTTAILLTCTEDLTPLTIGPVPALDQTVWTIGNCIEALLQDGAPALARGTVSGRDVATQAETRGRGGAVVSRYQGPVLELTIATNEGGQGSAVVDDAGRLVGLATQALIKARRQGAAVPWAVIAADLQLPAPSLGDSDPLDPAWLVTIAWRRPGGLGNPEAVPRPTRAVESAPPAERGLVGQWWNAWFHQRQVFRTDHPCSAVVVDPAKGLLLTAASNLAGDATSGSLMVAGVRREVTVVATDDPLDLALVRCEVPLDLPAVPWSQRLPAVQSPVRILGRHRADGPDSRTTGVMSAQGRRLSQSSEQFFQVDARADYGSLGGPILDADGGVVGLVVHLGPTTPWLVASGVTLGVDAATIANALGELRQGHSRDKLPTLGLGVTIDDRQDRLLITEVASGTGAAVAGIKSGDVLVAIEGHPVSSHPAVARMLLKHQAGDRVQVTVERGVRRIILPVEIRTFGGGP